MGYMIIIQLTERILKEKNSFNVGLIIGVRNNCKGSSFRYLCGQKACHNCCLFDYVQSYVQRKIHAADCTFWRYQSIAEHDQ